MLEHDDQERRRQIRVDFDTQVTVKADGTSITYQGSSRDLSLRGVFIKTDDLLASDTLCQVEIRLAGLDDELILNMDGHVVRSSNDGYAIFFDSLDLDSYTHLKNVVKFNAPDSENP